MRMDTHPIISKACDAVGGIAALSRLLTVKPPTVHQWLRRRRPVPIERCAAIERATKGAVTRQELRPEDYWLIWPDLPAPTQEPAHA